MPEGESQSNFEKNARAVVAVMDALYHGEFEKALKPDSFAQFYDAMMEIIGEQVTVGIGEFAVQFFLSEDPDKPTDQDNIPWLAVHYNFAVNDNSYSLQPTHALIPKDDRNLWDINEMDEVRVVSLGWNDIRDDFDINRIPHSSPD